MPKRTPADIELIRQTYEQTGSGRETARQLGLHDNTVYIALRRLRGNCKSGCARPAAPGKAYCQPCLERLALRKKTLRAERRRLGTCSECDERVDSPVSRTLCPKHRLAAIDSARDAAAAKTTRRRGTCQGKSSREQRERWLKEAYKPGGLSAWIRDDATCVICAATFDEKAIHLHHVDLDKTNHVEANFACLCFDCHRLVHAILGNPNAGEAIAWTAMTYPGFRPPEHVPTPPTRTG